MSARGKKRSRSGGQTGWKKKKAKRSWQNPVPLPRKVKPPVFNRVTTLPRSSVCQEWFYRKAPQRSRQGGTGRFGHVVHGAEAQRGLVPTLKSLYFPDYNFEKALSRAPAATSLFTESTAAATKLSRKANRTLGRSRGKHVDHQITRLCEILASSKVTAASVLKNKAAASRTAGLCADDASWLKNVTLHPFSRQFLTFAKPYQVLGSQWVCVFPPGRCGTHADVVLVDKRRSGDWKIVVLEIKTGSRRVLDVSLGQMKGVMKQHANNSLWHQYQLQAYVTAKMFARPAGKQLAKARVVPGLIHLSTDGYRYEEVSGEFWRGANLWGAIQTDLVRTRSQTRKDRQSTFFQ